MAVWTGLVALILALAAAVFAPPIDPFLVLRSLLELFAVLSVFALICAAEAST